MNGFEIYIIIFIFGVLGGLSWHLNSDKYDNTNIPRIIENAVVGGTISLVILSALFNPEEMSRRLLVLLSILSGWHSSKIAETVIKKISDKYFPL